MVKRKDDSILTEEALAGQIPEYVEPTVDDSPESKQIKRLAAFDRADKYAEERAAASDKMLEAVGATRLGGNIFDSAEARSGWIAIDRALLGVRDYFYPEDWQFLVRPATVEVVRNWSMLDENNGNSIDDVFNEILKYCLSIKTSTGTRPWQDINNWDRFFFVLLIRE